MQMTVAATLVIAAVLTFAGFAIAARISHHDRAQVDRQLSERVTKILTDYNKPGDGREAINNDKTGEPLSITGDGLLAGSETLTRVLVGPEVIAQRGQFPTAPLAIPADVGFSDVRIDGDKWRSLTQSIAAVPGARLQVLQSLAPVEERLHQNRQLIALVTVVAVALSGLGTWIVATMTLRPLRRLQVGARSMRPVADTTQLLPEFRYPKEVADLATTLNTMLERLQASANATRRFTADAGHELRTPLTALGFDLETLRDHPDLAEAQRHQMLDAMASEHQRLSNLLDGLLALARGDAEALPIRSEVDLSDLMNGAIDAARARHRAVTITFNDRAGNDPVIDGWPEGLRLAVDNLIDNAARHGRPNGRIDIALDHPESEWFEIEIADDGTGIPESERDAVVQRFARGTNIRSAGAGLGLAVTEQQAHLHGGQLILSTAPTGGLAATLRVRRTDR